MKKILVFTGIVILSLTLMSSTIDLDFLFNYENQEIPDYIIQDNTDNNPVSDAGATLGRVLFYDKHLSSDNSIACASCHQQEFAFSDTSLVSTGVNGVTGRHSMRLVNARFAEEGKFFWDKRASTLEQQTTMPVQDHAEMGYSGTNGDPTFEDLIEELYNVEYYDDLFYFVYGDTEITEERIQESLAQFIRSIQSFDSRYDEGLSMVDSMMMPFPNFTPAENRGKLLFMQLPELDNQANRIGGGAGCNSCHRAPEFDIDPVSRTNGIIQELNGGVNFEIHRSPSLRDVFNPFTGELNGALMHNGQFTDMESVIAHYGDVGKDLTISQISQLDTRFRVGPNAQKLNLTDQDIDDMVAFFHTLSGTNMYVDERWSDPFDINGDLAITGSPLNTYNLSELSIKAYPNPVVDYLNIESESNLKSATIYDQNGNNLGQYTLANQIRGQIDFTGYSSGVYLITLELQNGKTAVHKVVKL